MTEPRKMALTSMDIADEKREELKRCLGQAFPEVLAEGAVDFEQLRRVLGDWVEPGKERFGLNWPGKAECMKIIQQPSVATLKPAREESVNFDETENLFIEGDNLEVLKLLQKAYFGKVKMIYIDPPYNTGKEFIYPDKYSETLETYLAYSGQIDAMGKKFSTNTDAVGRYHTNWLNMMYPRLYLARNLLREDGVIFISIDDHEMVNLRQICDEVFGEENFIATVCWQKKYAPSNDATDISPSHDYIVAYLNSRRISDAGRNLSILNRLERDDSMNKPYKNPDNDPRGDWRADNYLCNKSAEERPNLYYPIVNPNTGKEIWPKKTAVWRYSKEQHQRHVDEDRVWWGVDRNNSTPAFKRFLTDVGGKMPTTWWTFDEVGHNDEAKKEINRLFSDTDRNFDTPKPIRLIRRIIELSQHDEGDIILDFFAGSATTAHAAMLHSVDSKAVKYILVQLPEPIQDKQYKTIADIGKERIRRAAKKIAEERHDQLDLEGNGKLDLGFKVYKLDRSNFNTWQGDADTFDESGKQLEMHVEHLSPESSAEDVLYELLLKAGFPLTTKVETHEMAGKQVFSIEDGALLICLEKEVTPELIDALADAEPLQIICLDAAFKGNDQLKANAVQTFKARAQAEESEIVFKTV